MANQKRFDEFNSNGKIELGRSGNLVSVKNKYTAEEIKNRNRMIASHIEEAKDETTEEKPVEKTPKKGKKKSKDFSDK